MDGREDTNPWEILGISADGASNRASSKVGITPGDAGCRGQRWQITGLRGPTQGETQSDLDWNR